MVSDMVRIFVGYDRRIPVAFQVLVHSITARSSLPVTICPINLTNIANLYSRDFNELQSTEFSFSRFLTPYLSGYEGWSIFMDNDIILLDDIAKLWALRDDRYAVMCVKHEHKPTEDKKFLGAVQTKYEKKNWSSVILFNNSKCRALTKDYVNSASGLELHQFKWLGDDSLIGAIPKEWNHLVDCDNQSSKPSLLHYTIGAPVYPDFANCGYSKEWFKEYIDANSSIQADMYQISENARKHVKKDS